jgi:hypothetical protein
MKGTSMRTTLRILLLALLALSTALILSCGPPPVSINDRISMFVASLNGNMSDTYTNCDPNASQYNAAKVPTFWSALFGFSGYSVSNVNTSNSAAVTALISSSGGSGTYTFAMVNSPTMGSDNWLISTITAPVAGVIFQ